MTTLTTPQQTTLEKAVTGTIYFVELRFRDSTQYLSSSNINISWGGHDWIGLGAIGSISAIEESQEWSRRRLPSL